MVEVLNFGASEKKKLVSALKALKGHSEAETKTEHEEYRCRVGADTVTVYSTGKVTIQGNSALGTKKDLLASLGLEKEVMLGIDEAGRGEREGPLVVSAVYGDKNLLRELRDSKKVKAGSLKAKHDIVSRDSLAIASVVFNAEFVDLLRNKGITMDEMQARSANAFIGLFDSLNERPAVRIDGSPLKGIQRGDFIVKGDDLEPVIGAASINAKYARTESKDRKERKTWRKKND